MSVIAWDGKTLAADKQMTAQGLKRTVTKIKKINGCLVGCTGDYDGGLAMMNWFENGGAFPECQKDKERWSNLLVIKPDGGINLYEREPFCYVIEDKFYAMGSGRDYAMAAMYLGKGAVEAVGIAMVFDSNCGMGLDELEVGSE